MKYFNKFSDSFWVNITVGLFIFIFMCLLCTFVSFVLMLGWNNSMPHLFGMPEMDMLNSLGLLIVTSILGFAFRVRVVINKKG